jgi:hypothetical protein
VAHVYLHPQNLRHQAIQHGLVANGSETSTMLRLDAKYQWRQVFERYSPRCIAKFPQAICMKRVFLRMWSSFPTSLSWMNYPAPLKTRDDDTTRHRTKAMNDETRLCIPRDLIWADNAGICSVVTQRHKSATRDRKWQWGHHNSRLEARYQPQKYCMNIKYFFSHGVAPEACGRCHERE